MVRPAVATLATLLALNACQEWHLSVNSDGLVLVSVAGTPLGPQHRFRVRTREADGSTRTLDVPASGQLALRTASEGSLQLTLLTPPQCRVTGPNPHALAVSASQEFRLAFDVRCA